MLWPSGLPSNLQAVSKKPIESESRYLLFTWSNGGDDGRKSHGLTAFQGLDGRMVLDQWQDPPKHPTPAIKGHLVGVFNPLEGPILVRVQSSPSIGLKINRSETITVRKQTTNT